MARSVVWAQAVDSRDKPGHDVRGNPQVSAEAIWAGSCPQPPCPPAHARSTIPSVALEVGDVALARRLAGPKGAGGKLMPTIKVNDITMNYETQGAGEPLVLIPYLAADNACYAFQVADYAKHFACISVDRRGAGESEKPQTTYSTELFADDIAAFMQTIGVEGAHVSGLS